MPNVTVSLRPQDHKRLKIFAIDREVNMPDLAAFALQRLAQDIEQPEVETAFREWLTTLKTGRETAAP